jgi:hypothetical protein
MGYKGKRKLTEEFPMFWPLQLGGWCRHLLNKGRLQKQNGGE